MSTMSVWFAVSECPESSQASRSVEGPAETLQILSALGLIWVDSIAWDCLRLLQTAWGDWSVRYTRYSAYIQITSLQMHRQNSEYNTESARFFSVQLFQFGERIHVPLLSLLRITYDLRAFRAMRPNNRISPDTERYWEILRMQIGRVTFLVEEEDTAVLLPKLLTQTTKTWRNMLSEPLACCRILLWGTVSIWCQPLSRVSLDPSCWHVDPYSHYW